MNFFWKFLNPLWTILLGKTYVVTWTFSKLPSPYHVHTWFMNDPFLQTFYGKHQGTMKFYRALVLNRHRRCCNVRARICFRRLTLLALCFGLALLLAIVTVSPWYMYTIFMCCSNRVTFKIKDLEFHETTF